MITIQATKRATARTKNRIREHGPKFEFQRVDRPVCAKGESCVLVKSVKTDWLGWIPVKEVELV